MLISAGWYQLLKIVDDRGFHTAAMISGIWEGRAARMARRLRAILPDHEKQLGETSGCRKQPWWRTGSHPDHKAIRTAPLCDSALSLMQRLQDAASDVRFVGQID